MLKLHGRVRTSKGGEPLVLRLSREPFVEERLAGHAMYLLVEGEAAQDVPEGYAAAMSLNGSDVVPRKDIPLIVCAPECFSYLASGDIVRIAPQSGHLNVLYRQNSRHNSLLVTERCNSNCVMCSQPPKDFDDGHIVRELLEAIPLMSSNTSELGITGGEPTLIGEDLWRLIESIRDHLPDCALHILTNGRAFAYLRHAQRLASIRHADLMLGIPLYSDIPHIHDHVVQAHGAFDETLRGLLNLYRYGVRIELRVVIHRYTYERLPELAHFICRNLPFVDHVALMGLEMMGHVKMNLNALWVDPLDYKNQLLECVNVLDGARVPVSVYNHQLCTLDNRLWEFAVRSISDWKNSYMPECEGCRARDECGGFFTSAVLRYSRGIGPIALDS